MATRIVNKIAFAGMWRLKSTILCTNIAVIPDSAPKVVPRMRRLGFLNFLKPFLYRLIAIQIIIGTRISPVSEIKCR